MKNACLILAMGIATVSLSACKIEPDWERQVTAQQAGESRAEWLNAMRILPNGNVLVAVQSVATGTNRDVNILLSELDKQGNPEWQQVYDLGENESVAHLLVSGDSRYVLTNTPDGKTQLLVVDAKGQQRWVHSYQDGSARSMQLIANKIYITGKRTQVLDTTGKILVDVHQSEQTWALEVGLLGDFYVAGAKGMTAYDSHGNQLWFLQNTESGLSQQVDLVWQAGALYLAVHELQGSRVWLKKVNTFLGKAEWQRTILSPSNGSNSPEGPVLMQAPETGNIILVQSYQRGRQLTMLDARGHTQWQAKQDSGIARDFAINADDELIVTGNGITEQFSMQGERVAWASLLGQVQSTTGAVEVFGKSIYVGASIYRDGKIQAVVAHYTDQ